MVKTLVEKHSCLQSRNIKGCTYDFISQQIVEQIEANPDIPVRALQEQLQNTFEVGVSKMKAFRAKSKAKGQLKGDYTHQYARLRDYMQELLRTNPGTTIRLEVEHVSNQNLQTRVFKRIYVCLGALKEGFKATGREILGLDGAFMKGPFPGQLLTIVGLDPNNDIYPLAYAIVEAENRDSWTWFLQLIVIQAVETVFPSAEHMFCLRHIHENMKQSWKGQQYKNLLWKCATATTNQHFQNAMAEFKKFNRDAFMWLAKIPPKHWSRAHFSGRSQSDVLLNNLCEVFNKQLVDGRDKPIIMALEYVREYLMKRIVNVLHFIDKCEGPFTLTVTKLFESIKKEALQYRAVWNGEEKYQVYSPWGDQTVVDFKTRLCSCRRYDITGIPCKHMVATVWYMKENGQGDGIPEFWISPMYSLERWKQVYAFKVQPINGMSMWDKVDVPTSLLPPRHHTPVGRPKKKRKRAADEQMVNNGRLSARGKSITCGKCGKWGHNKRSCNGRGKAALQGSEKATAFGYFFWL